MDAMIIAGGGHGNDLTSHMATAKAVKRYLTCEALRSARIVNGTRIRASTLLDQIEREFTRKKRFPLLLVYIGHGSRRGWGIAVRSGLRGKRWEDLSYADLVDRIRQAKRPILLIDATCHAMAVVDVLKRRRVGHRRVGVIAAVSKNRQGARVGEFVLRAVQAWREKRKFHPKSSRSTIHASNFDDPKDAVRIFGDSRVARPVVLLVRNHHSGVSEVHVRHPERRWGGVFDSAFFAVRPKPPRALKPVYLNTSGWTR